MTRPRRFGPRTDAGSAMPLVLGMVMCLLLLGAGVTAATSAFLARANLQHVCDGAASAAADATQRTALTTAIPVSDDVATAVAADYVGARSTGVAVAAALTAGAVILACSTEAPIAFGPLFGTPTLTVTVRSVAHAVLTPA
jgi:Flp pilus assembly protein TadG